MTSYRRRIEFKRRRVSTGKHASGSDFPFFQCKQFNKYTWKWNEETNSIKNSNHSFPTTSIATKQITDDRDPTFSPAIMLRYYFASKVQ